MPVIQNSGIIPADASKFHTFFRGKSTSILWNIIKSGNCTHIFNDFLVISLLYPVIREGNMFEFGSEEVWPLKEIH